MPAIEPVSERRRPHSRLFAAAVQVVSMALESDVGLNGSEERAL